MSEQDFGASATPPEEKPDPTWEPVHSPPPAPGSPYGAESEPPPPPPSGYPPPPPGYTQVPPPPPGYYAQPAAAAPGLSETAASVLSYVTFIPALIFLLMAPYNQSARIKFHAIQELGLTVVMFVLSFFLVIPILGWLVYILGFLVCAVMWVLCIIKASQGSAFKLPFLGDFATQQSGYRT